MVWGVVVYEEVRAAWLGLATSGGRRGGKRGGLRGERKGKSAGADGSVLYSLLSPAHLGDRRPELRRKVRAMRVTACRNMWDVVHQEIYIFDSGNL